MLRDLAGQPLLAYVYQAVRSSPLLDDVVVATDSEEIISLCRERGWHARMTSIDHRSGTERVHEISNSIAADVYLNVQGDEPLTRAEHIDGLLELMNDPTVEVGTLKTPAARFRYPQSERSKSYDRHRGSRAVFFASDHSL